MRKFFQLLHSLSLGCGKLPLFGVVALCASVALGRLTALQTPKTAPNASAEALSPDAVLIDTILSKRAPELGMTLRRQLGVAIAQESLRAAYDPLLILAIINVESEFDEDAESNKGARGLMQIKPSTLHFLAEKEGLRLTRAEVASDPALCVRLGIRYLRQLQDRFGELDLALMAYNAGPARLTKAMRGRALEVFRQYPRRVRREFRRFREGEGLEGNWRLAEREEVTIRHR
jgi:soluble lytic murein transglycosylase-like protein